MSRRCYNRNFPFYKSVAFNGPLYLSAALLLLISSCHSFTEEPEPAGTTASNSITVDGARSWFESEISPKITSSNPHFRISTDLEKEPDWDAAENLDLEDGEALTVPLINKDRKRISLGKSEKLVFSQDAGGDMELQVVKAIGDSLHMRQEGFQIGSNKFTGITLLEDWEGNLIEGAYYRDGNIIGKLGDAHSSSKPAKEKPTGYNLRWEVRWIATDWFSIATAGGYFTIRFMETVYRPVYVYVDDDTRNTYGNYYDERRGGGGGGKRQNDCPYGPDCSSPSA